MFTGIVQGTATLLDLVEKDNFRTHIMSLSDELIAGLELGASVAHNGCCLTVSQIKGNKISFDLMQETLRLTNLGDLRIGDSVNIERAARFGDEIGGHAMSGHIMCTTELVNIIESENNYRIWFALPKGYEKYVFEKGYIGIDGISLTVGALDKGCFCVNLIPETLDRTVIGERGIGSRINIEIDPQTQAIVDTVERVMAQQHPTG